MCIAAFRVSPGKLSVFPGVSTWGRVWVLFTWKEGKKEGKVLFNDALYVFYFTIIR